MVDSLPHAARRRKEQYLSYQPTLDDADVIHMELQPENQCHPAAEITDSEDERAACGRDPTAQSGSSL